MKKLAQKRLKELLHYDPETGIFTWIARILSQGRTTRLAGRIAGSINKITGYRFIGINRKTFLASRLAWLYMEGYFPENDIDHINRIRHDDRWANLRHVAHQCNSRNCKKRIDNTSGITGVYWDTKRQKWCAHVVILNKKFHLGYFASKIDAARARWNAEVRHNFPGCNSISSARLYIQKYTR